MAAFGLPGTVFDAMPAPGGNAAVSSLWLAEVVVGGGGADVVLIVFARDGASGRRIAARTQLLPGQQFRAQLEHPHGYAMICRRHMAEYGTSKDHLAAVALSAHRYAQGNPRAMRRGRLLTRQDHDDAPMIADPYQRYDCCLETDGAAAVVVTGRGDGRAVPVLAVATARPESPDDLTNRADWLRVGLTEAAPAAYEQAGAAPSALDALMIYDCFTFEVIHQLEEAGFCTRGEGGAFVASGGIDPGGRLPVNPHGGLLAEGHLGGLNHVIEAVRQRRGEAGRGQVEEARLVGVTGWADWGVGSMAILGGRHDGAPPRCAGLRPVLAMPRGAALGATVRAGAPELAAAAGVPAVSRARAALAGGRRAGVAVFLDGGTPHADARVPPAHALCGGGGRAGRATGAADAGPLPVRSPAAADRAAPAGGVRAGERRVPRSRLGSGGSGGTAMRWSVVMPGSVTERLAEAAARAEKAGLYRLWTTEGPGRDAIVRSAHLLQATTTLESGTGIAFAFPRPPLATAGAAADAAALSGGRFSLGLGAGTRGQRRWFGVDFDHPAARMADYVRAVKAVLTANGSVHYDGRFYQLSVPRLELAAPPELLERIEVYGGGLHERMLRAVADSCDGIVLHPLAGGARYLDEVVLPIIADSGRDPHLVVWCPVTLAQDAALARRRAAEQLAFYFSTPSYADVAERCGFGAVAAELVQRYNNGPGRPSFTDMAALVPDEMADFFVVNGTPTEVAGRLAERAAGWRERGVDEVALQIGAQSITAEDLLMNIDQLAAIVGAMDVESAGHRRSTGP